MTERERLTALVHEVAVKVGYVQDIPIKTTDYPYGSQKLPDFPMVAADIPDKSILWVPGTLGLISDDHLRGSIAHEIGHLMTKPPSAPSPEEDAAMAIGEMLGIMPSFPGLKEWEHKADAWAARHGYGSQLVSFFTWIGQHFGLPLDKSLSPVHPPLQERIDRVKRILEH